MVPPIDLNRPEVSPLERGRPGTPQLNRFEKTLSSGFRNAVPKKANQIAGRFRRYKHDFIHMIFLSIPIVSYRSFL